MRSCRLVKHACQQGGAIIQKSAFPRGLEHDDEANDGYQTKVSLEKREMTGLGAGEWLEAYTQLLLFAHPIHVLGIVVGAAHGTAAHRVDIVVDELKLVNRLGCLEFWRVGHCATTINKGRQSDGVLSES